MKINIHKNFQQIIGIELFKEYLPIFATQDYANYLQDINGSKTIWITSINKNENFMIPISILKKGPFKKGTFLTSVISTSEQTEIEKEKLFLNTIVNYLKANNFCDWIQQCPNWAIFNTFPDEAIYAPFGTYRLKLENVNEENLFKNLDKDVRNKVRRSFRKEDNIVKNFEECVDDSIELIDSTLQSAKIDTFSKNRFKKIKKHLGENILGKTFYLNGMAQSSNLVLFNSYCAYGIYAGSIKRAAKGATERIIWELFMEAKKRNLKYFDMVGGRIYPDKDSKLYRIQRNKSHYGTDFKEGFIWKMIINNFKYQSYVAYVKILNILKGKENKGDIIDQERKRLNIR